MLIIISEFAIINHLIFFNYYISINNNPHRYILRGLSVYNMRRLIFFFQLFLVLLDQRLLDIVRNEFV